MIKLRAFAEIVGRPAERLPARGTGSTMPFAIRSLLLANGVPASDVSQLLPRMVELLPQLSLRMRRTCASRCPHARGRVCPEDGARADALRANRRHGKPQAQRTGLEAFGLDAFLNTEIGGYSSDDEHRPALVAVAQKRAQAKLGTAFTRSNTVIIGDSLEDVRTGAEGGASVIGIASGKTTARELASAGADAVLDSLEDVPRLLEEITTAVRTSSTS